MILWVVGAPFILAQVLSQTQCQLFAIEDLACVDATNIEGESLIPDVVNLKVQVSLQRYANLLTGVKYEILAGFLVLRI